MAPQDRGALLPAALAFVLVSFALNSVMTRLVVAQGLLDPGLTTAVRFLAGALSLGLLLGSTGRLRSARPTRASVAPAFWLGAYALFISYGYLFIGAAAGTFASNAAVLVTMTLFGAVAEGERPRNVAILGSLLALAGVGVLALGRVEGVTLPGVALLSAMGASWGLYSVLGRRSAAPLQFTAANFFALAVPLLPFAAVLFVSGAPWTLQGLVIAAFMGGVTTALTYAVWYWLLPRITRVQAGTAQLTVPVITALLGVAMLGEALGPRLVLAGALVVAGMAIVVRAAPARPASPETGGATAKP